MSLLDGIFSNAAYYLRSQGGDVEIGGGAGPSLGQVLRAISGSAARWMSLPPSGVVSVNGRGGDVVLDYTDVGLSDDEWLALSGTDGDPSDTNRYVTDSDPRFAETAAHIAIGAAHIADTSNPHAVTAAQVGAPPTSRTISAGTRMTGGGDLSADRTLAVDSATDTLLTNTSAHLSSTSNPHSTTAAQVGAVPTARTVSAGTRLTGGGDLSANRTLSIDTTTDTLLTNTSTHLASTSNPHSTTASQVGLGSVTNDAQLKRSANDFTAFTHKTNPTNVDILLIEDQAASYVKKYIQVSELLALGAGINARIGNPFIDPPTTANAFDVEFNTNVNDLATLGFTVKSSAGGSALTRSGDVNPWDTTGPTSGTYWSTCMGSWLLIQFPVASVTYFVYKAVTLTAGDIYWARVGSSVREDGGTTGFYLETGLYANASGLPDTNNRYYVSSYSSSAGGIQMDMQRTNAGAYAGSGKTMGGGAIPDLRGIRFGSGTTFQCFSAQSDSGNTHTAAPSGGINGTSIAWFALGLAPLTGFNGTVPMILSVDFVRKAAAGKWIAQP